MNNRSEGVMAENPKEPTKMEDRDASLVRGAVVSVSSFTAAVS